MRGWKLSTAHLGILLLPSGVFLDAFLDHLFLILVELYDLVELLTSNLLSAGLAGLWWPMQLLRQCEVC